MAYTAGTLCVRIMSNEEADCQKRPRGVMVARGDFIAVAAVASVLCGAFLPVPAWLVDIVWGCSLCLSTALVLIGLTGKDPLELSGFGPLMVLGALLRMGLSTATAGLVFRGSVAGTLIEAAGNPLTGLGAVAVLLGLPIAAGVIASLVFRSAGRITSTAVKCLTEVIPENERTIVMDEQAGLIRPQRAQELKEAALGQTCFFWNMGGAAKLLRCDAVLAASMILTIIVGELVMFTARGTMSASSLRACAAAAAGAGAVMLLPMLMIALAAARLTRRSGGYLAQPHGDEGRQRGEVIEIVSQETGRHEQVELLNPDFVLVSEGTGTSETASERIVELKPCGAAGGEHAQTAEAKPAICPEDYYDDLAACVAGLEAGKTPVLFAAETSDSLPVTVAVNVGIRLARRGLRTLLIDAGAAREAVAAVFDADVEGMHQGPVATCVENLHVWGLRAMARAGTPTIETATRRAAGDYDRVILYAPDLMQHEHGGRVIDAVTSAVIFAERSGGGNLRSLLEQAGCTMIEQKPVLRSGPDGLTEHV